MKELKGKDFVFDRNGNVIVIQQMKPEKMPPYAYSMDVTIQGGNDEILAPVSTVSPTKKQSKKKKSINLPYRCTVCGNYSDNNPAY